MVKHSLNSGTSASSSNNKNSGSSGGSSTHNNTNTKKNSGGSLRDSLLDDLSSNEVDSQMARELVSLVVAPAKATLRCPESSWGL